MSRKENEVWQACDDLLAMGKSPREITGEAIGNRLRELGLKAGNLTYRYRYRDSWMEERGLSRESFAEEDLKSSDLIERSAAIFRRSIEDGLREEYQTKHQETKTELESLNQLYQTSCQTLEKTELDKTAVAKELAASLHEIATLHQRLNQEHEARIKFEERSTIAEKQCDYLRLDYENQLRQYKEIYENVSRVLQKTQEETENRYKKEIEALRTLLESERHQWLVENDALKVRKIKLEEQLNKAGSLEKELRTALTEKGQEIKHLETELAALQSKRYLSEQSSQLSQQELAVFRSEKSQLQTRLREKDQYCADLQHYLSAEREKMDRLEAQLSVLIAEVTKERKVNS